MEELLIEEKAKRYDKAIERAKNYYSTTDSASDIKLIGLIFPELKESEDERIMKKIIATIHLYYGEPLEDEAKEMIAWLEKQGNLMKALQISNAKIGELIEKNYYLKEQLEKQGKNNMGISEATKQKLEDNLNKALEKETPESWNKFLDEQGEQKPVFEMKTPEESLGIDSETYNKIVDECVYGEQKSAAWSEEDERMRKAIIDNIQAICEEGYFVGNIDSDELIEWLKSIRPQSQWKPSDEQMDALRYVTNFDYGGYKATLVSLYEQLKKLRGE